VNKHRFNWLITQKIATDTYRLTTYRYTVLLPSQVYTYRQQRKDRN